MTIPGGLYYQNKFVSFAFNFLWCCETLIVVLILTAVCYKTCQMLQFVPNIENVKKYITFHYNLIYFEILESWFLTKQLVININKYVDRYYITFCAIIDYRLKYF